MLFQNNDEYIEVTYILIYPLKQNADTLYEMYKIKEITSKK